MNKKIIKFGIIIFAVLAVLVIAVQRCTTEKLKDSLQLKSVELSTLKDSVTVYRSKNGELTFQINSELIEKDNLKKSLTLSGLTIKELKQQGIYWRDISAVYKAKLETSGHVETVTKDSLVYVKGDSIKITKVEDWDNRFLFLRKGIIQDKKLSFDYTYRLSLTVIPTETRKQTVLNITSNDPKAMIVSGTSFTIVKKKRMLEKWWITLPAGFVGGYLLTRY